MAPLLPQRVTGGSTCTARCAAGASGATSDSSAHIEFLGQPGVPALGLGLAALGRPGYINLSHGQDLADASVDGLQRQCWDVLDAAWGLGLRYFDAARSYGRAEEFLSGWLASRHVAPPDVLVGSKWGYMYTADWRTDTGGQPHEVKEHSAARLRVQSRETAQHLGDHLRVYAIHSATLESGVLEAEDVLAALEQLRRDKGWRIGLSVSGVQQAEVVRRALALRASDGSRLFECVQATWNLLDQSAGAALCEARAAGVSVVVKEAVANGRLTERNLARTPRLEALKRAAEQVGSSMDAVAIAAAILQPFKPLVLSGATTAQQLHSNAGALKVCDSISKDLLQLLQAELVQRPQEYWAERSALAWN